MRVFEDPEWREARILTASSPREKAKGLKALVAREHVHPVSNFDPTDEREHLVRGEIERVQGQAEFVVLDQREESVGAVVDPVDARRLVAIGHSRLDESLELPDRRDGMAVGGQQVPVCGPGRSDGLGRVVEDADVP